MKIKDLFIAICGLLARKTDCALCNDKITKDSNVKVEYLKINGNIGIYMMHDKCYKKIKKYDAKAGF